MSRDWNSTATGSHLRAQREVISTSLPIGTKPQARNARSDAALPGETWAHTRSPEGTTARPARSRARPRTAVAIGGVVQLDRELEPSDKAAAERQQAAVVAEHARARAGGRGHAGRVGGDRDRAARRVDRRDRRWRRARRRANRSNRRRPARSAVRRDACRAAEAVRRERAGRAARGRSTRRSGR